VNFTVHLAEVDDGWGYRLHDPRLPAQLWSSAKRGISTDVQLRVGRRSFAAHRAILSARSSVFAAILKRDECNDSWNNNIDDGRLSIIDIGEDVDPDVFQDFLVFVYTGRLRTTENMAELWAAANKYDVKTLERIGESAKGRTAMEELCVTLMSSL
jgi:speckle-type POZ protein